MASYWNGPVHGSSCQISTVFRPLFVVMLFWDQLDEPKVSETENFLGEIPVWGCFDENCDVSTFERGSLLRTPPCLWNVFFQNNQKPMKTTGGDFPQADAVSQLQKVSWRKSTGDTHTPRNWRNGHGYQKMVLEIPWYLWTNCRCHFRFIWLKFGGGFMDEEIPKKALVDKKIQVDFQEMEVSKIFFWPWIFRVNIPISYGCIALAILAPQVGCTWVRPGLPHPKPPTFLRHFQLRVSKISPLFVKNLLPCFGGCWPWRSPWACGLKMWWRMSRCHATSVRRWCQPRCPSAFTRELCFFLGGHFFGDIFVGGCCGFEENKQVDRFCFFNGAWAWSGWLLDHVGCLRWECSSVTEIDLFCMSKNVIFWVAKKIQKTARGPPGPSVETCQSMPSNLMSQITRKFHLMQICDVAYSECNNAVAYDPYLNQYAACQKMRRMHPTEGTPVGGVGGGKFGWCFLLFERNRYKAFQSIPEVKSFSNKKMLSFKGCILQQELLGRFVICCYLLSGGVSETMKYLGIAGELFQIAHPNPNLFLVGVCVSRHVANRQGENSPKFSSNVESWRLSLFFYLQNLRKNTCLKGC